MKFLVLYEELASYFVNCLNHLAKNHQCQILVISKQINPIAPFEFNNLHFQITLIEREAFSIQDLEHKIKFFNPHFTYVSGWIHKPYLQIIKKLNLSKVIMGLDNPYTGSWRQKLGAIYFKTQWKQIIHAAFVPGTLQQQFALKLGFKETQIALNLYCCDNNLYSSFYEQSISHKNSIPKRFVFVGRYVEEKGIQLLWKAFQDIQTEQPNDWELWCLGKGPLQAPVHPKIKHLGFIQPADLLPVIQQCGVFVLPSLYEPWGVVLHEFACAGFPIICSNKVGASEIFLQDKINGYQVPAGDYYALKKALKKIVSLTDAELQTMAQKSCELSQQISPEVWTESLLKLVHVSTQ